MDDDVAVEVEVEVEVEVAESLEWSLPVPSVQELATSRLAAVPERYVRHEHDMVGIGSVIPSSNPCITVPLIDMTKLVDPQQHQLELQRLHSACKDWGLFHLINHGVSNEAVKSMKRQAQEFFDLPLQEKKRWAKQPGSLEGYGQAFVTSHHQKLEWNDMLFLQTLPPQRRNLSLWPQQQLPTFSEALGNYSEEMGELVVGLMKFMAKALELEHEQLSQHFQQGNYDVRINYYPPCPEPQRVLGVNPHADICGLTLLLECGDVAGLQVQKGDQWFLVEPHEDAIVINIGQIMEVISNGIYKAPLHRAVVNGFKERISVVTFCYPDPSLTIEPAKQLIDKSGGLPLYKSLTSAQYFHHFLNRKLDDPFIDMLKLKS